LTKQTPESLQVLNIIEAKQGRTTKKELIEELQTLKMTPTYGPSQPKSAPHSRLRAILDPLEVCRGWKKERSIIDRAWGKCLKDFWDRCRCKLGTVSEAYGSCPTKKAGEQLRIRWSGG
jgi:hypothetical protein